jgi:hypothetical protein
LITLEYEFGDCDNVQVSAIGYFSRWTKPIAWVCLALFFCSIFSILLNVKYLITRLRLFVKHCQIKSKLEGISIFKKIFYSLNEIPMFVSWWVISFFAADVCNIISSVYVCFVVYSRSHRHFFMGLGALLGFFNLTRYLEYTPNLYVCFLTKLNNRHLLEFFRKELEIF